MIAQTSETRIWAHRLPAGAKMLALIAVTLVLLWFDALWLQALLLAATLALYLSGGRDFALSGLRALRGILWIAALIGLWQVLTRDPATAALVVMRLLTAVALANFVTLTTRLDALAALADRVMVQLFVPTRVRQRIALAMALVLRFVPVLIDKSRRLSEAWRARSTRRLSPRIVLPLALLAIDDADQVAEALRARSAGLSPDARQP